MMSVDIDIQNALFAVVAAQVFNRNGAIIEYAKPAAMVAIAMVKAGDGYKSTAVFALYDAIDHVDDRADDGGGGFENAGARGRVAMIDKAFSLIGAMLDAVDIFLIVEGLQRGFITLMGVQPGHAFAQLLGFHAIEKSLVAQWAKRVFFSKMIVGQFCAGNDGKRWFGHGVYCFFAVVSQPAVYSIDAAGGIALKCDAFPKC